MSMPKRPNVKQAGRRSGLPAPAARSQPPSQAPAGADRPVLGLPADSFSTGSAINQAIRNLASIFGVALVVALAGVRPPSRRRSG